MKLTPTIWMVGIVSVVPRHPCFAAVLFRMLLIRSLLWLLVS